MMTSKAWRVPPFLLLFVAACGSADRPESCTESPCPVVLVAGLFGSNLAVDAGSIYFTTSDSIMKAPVGGGSPTTLASAQKMTNSFTLDSENVYWTTYDKQLGGSTVSAVMKMPRDGGTPSTLASFTWTDTADAPTAGQEVVATSLRGLAVRASSVYFIALEAPGPAATPPYRPIREVLTVPSEGGAVSIVVSDLGDSIAVDEENVFGFRESPGSLSDLVKVPLDGGALMTLAESTKIVPADITVDTTHVYWSTIGATAGSSTISSVPLEGGTPTKLAPGGNSGANIAIDATSVYYVQDDAIFKVPLEGGTPTILAANQEGAWAIAVDDTSVYWSKTTSDSPEIDKLTPK